LRRDLVLDTLLPTLPVRAWVLAAWRLEDQWVTAVRLTNTSAQWLDLDPRALQGDFVAATFQHPDLGPAGNPSDTTVVYLVTRGRGLAESLLPAISPIDASLNLPASAAAGHAEPKEPAMRSNGLLKWLMLPMALLIVFVGVKLFSGDRRPADTARSRSRLTAEEMRALGIEGDTPRDTVATLVAQVRQLRTELQTALADNRSQRAENERLRQRERSIDQRIESALDAERARLRQDREQIANERQQAQGLLQDLRRQFDGLWRAGYADLPIGLGLEVRRRRALRPRRRHALDRAGRRQAAEGGSVAAVLSASPAIFGRDTLDSAADTSVEPRAAPSARRR
jgi:regulator of replication initiation timing